MATSNRNLQVAGLVNLAALLAGVLAAAAGCGKESKADKGEHSLTEATARLIAEARGQTPPEGTSYNEAPMFAGLVERGKLPPVWKRLPDSPMVVPVHEEIGRYGGTWRRMMKGISDIHAHTRITYENIVRWAPNPKDGVRPNLAESWEFENNYKLLRLHLRKGLKWSDGHPFTTDDIVFWWTKIANDLDLTPGTPIVWCPGGKPMVVRKIDETTIELHFAQPYALAIKILAFKGGQWPLAFERYGFFAPKHYLEPALPTAGAEVKRPPGMKPSYDLFERMAYDFNPDRPVMSAWRISQVDEGARVVSTRNPYYWKVDPEGNQLPYIDYVQHEFFFNDEMLNFRALTGEIDMQVRHFSSRSRFLLREFAAKRGYRMLKFHTGWVTGFCVNMEYKHDPVLREYFRMRDFRRALSLAIDRELIREITGKDIIGPATYGQSPYCTYYKKLEGIDTYLRYDPPEANRLLDKVGLTRRDADGFRVMTDGRTMSVIMETYGNSPSVDAEIISAGWKAVGVKTSIQPRDRTNMDLRVEAGEPMAMGSSAEAVFSVLRDDLRFGIGKVGGWCWAYGNWYRTKGRQGVAPPDEVKRLQRIYEQMQVTEDVGKQKKLMAEVIRAHAENVWYMPTTGPTSFIGIAKNDFRNIPLRGLGTWVGYFPGHLNPEQFFFKR